MLLSCVCVWCCRDPASRPPVIPASVAAARAAAAAGKPLPKRKLEVELQEEGGGAGEGGGGSREGGGGQHCSSSLMMAACAVDGHSGCLWWNWQCRWVLLEWRVALLQHRAAAGVACASTAVQ
jgi:hypothetical protein